MGLGKILPSYLFLIAFLRRPEWDAFPGISYEHNDTISTVATSPPWKPFVQPDASFVVDQPMRGQNQYVTMILQYDWTSTSYHNVNVPNLSEADIAAIENSWKQDENSLSTPRNHYTPRLSSEDTSPIVSEDIAEPAPPPLSSQFSVTDLLQDPQQEASVDDIPVLMKTFSVDEIDPSISDIATPGEFKLDILDEIMLNGSEEHGAGSSLLELSQPDLFSMELGFSGQHNSSSDPSGSDNWHPEKALFVQLPEYVPSPFHWSFTPNSYGSPDQQSSSSRSSESPQSSQSNFSPLPPEVSIPQYVNVSKTNHSYTATAQSSRTLPSNPGPSRRMGRTPPRHELLDAGIRQSEQQIVHSSTEDFNVMLKSMTPNQVTVAKSVRKRGRNRMAASKVRNKVLNNIEEIKERVTELKAMKEQLLEKRRRLESILSERIRRHEQMMNELVRSRASVSLALSDTSRPSSSTVPDSRPGPSSGNRGGTQTQNDVIQVGDVTESAGTDARDVTIFPVFTPANHSTFPNSTLNHQPR